MNNKQGILETFKSLISQRYYSHSDRDYHFYLEQQAGVFLRTAGECRGLL